VISITNGPHDTREEAEEAEERILVNYHPAGYGTTTEVVPRVDGWYVIGRRAKSCD
jgi:hypothetical protein